MCLYKAQQLFMLDKMSLGQRLQHAENLAASAQVSTCQLSDNERMTKSLLIKQQALKTLTSCSEMLDPNRGVYKDHARRRVRRRLRISRSCLSVPPRLAKRRALSLAMRVSSPKRTNEVFSLTPVSLAASRRRESSIFSVVLICVRMPQACIWVKSKERWPEGETRELCEGQKVRFKPGAVRHRFCASCGNEK